MSDSIKPKNPMPSTRSPKAMALLVGLKNVDPLHYGSSNSYGCEGSEEDVDRMDAILRPLGYEITCLKTAKARGDIIMQQLKRAASVLTAGDILVFFFSGHGGQKSDDDDPEADKQDETLLAYDRRVVDDELNEVWSKLKAGVRVVMLSDSCNSGTNYKFWQAVRTAKTATMRTLQAGKALNDTQAQIIHFGACADGYSAVSTTAGGVFTMALDDVWNNGAFQGSYDTLHQRVHALIKRRAVQASVKNEYGPVTAAFRNQRPFTV